MTITTPEQMREAAALEADRIENSYLATIIRAIPIAQQPMEVTVNHIGLRGERARISIPAAMCGAPYIGSYDYVALSALSPQPADPLSDPRVKALVDAEHLAALLWREQAVNTGAPESVAAGRTAAAFADQSSEIRRTWLKFAACALRAIGGEA